MDGKDLIPGKVEITPPTLAEIVDAVLEAEKMILPAIEKVETVVEANNAGRKVLLIRKVRDEVKEKVKILKREIDKRIKEAEAKFVEAEEAMLGSVETWAKHNRELVADKRGVKSIKLDDCKLGWRKGQGMLNVLDDDRAVKWAEDRGLPIKVKKIVDKKAIKEFFKEEPGEIDEEIFEFKRGENKFFVQG